MSTKQNLCRHVVFSQYCCFVANFVDKAFVDDSTNFGTPTSEILAKALHLRHTKTIRLTVRNCRISLFMGFCIISCLKRAGWTRWWQSYRTSWTCRWCGLTGQISSTTCGCVWEWTLGAFHRRLVWTLIPSLQLFGWSRLAERRFLFEEI